MVEGSHPLRARYRELSELPAEASAERRFPEARGVVSWLCVPIRAGGVQVGYQAFETISSEKHWDEAEIAALRLMTELLAAAILRHRSELALMESERKFAHAFRDHPDAMVIFDLETDAIVECNDQWIVEAGVESSEQVIGHKLWDFAFEVPEDRREAMRSVLGSMGRTPAVEIPVKGRGGEDRTYLISATRIKIGGRACALYNVHDLTDRKQLEQQLLHAQKMEALGRLAGGIAHDYNNILTVITGFSSSLMRVLEDEQLRDVSEIHDAARRSADLTRQLLAFSRRQVLQTEVLDPTEVVTKLEAMLRPLIGESVELRLELAPSIGRVRSDRGQLEQAIVNLVVNGRDAMPDGGALVVETRSAEYSSDEASGRVAPVDLEPGAYAVTSVADRGIGMDPELIDHTMEPFYTTKPRGSGTGLGLPMVHGLARQCGGTLVLEERHGGGTRAQIILPVSMDEAIVSVETPASERTIESACHPILLAEDEAILRRFVARTLRAAGYEVIEVEDGEQARQRALELGDGFDLLVSDVVMPRLSGIDLVALLRDQRPELPVVLMSGYPDAPGSRPVPDDVLFLLKPFEPEQLCDAAAEAIRAKQREAEPAR